MRNPRKRLAAWVTGALRCGVRLSAGVRPVVCGQLPRFRDHRWNQRKATNCDATLAWHNACPNSATGLSGDDLRALAETKSKEINAAYETAIRTFDSQPR
jgi:hypothetical protein